MNDLFEDDLVRAIPSRELIAALRSKRKRDADAINRRGDMMLDPRRHAWQHSGSPWVTDCAWCGRPPEDHRSHLGLLLAWLLNKLKRARR